MINVWDVFRAVSLLWDINRFKSFWKTQQTSVNSVTNEGKPSSDREMDALMIRYYKLKYTHSKNFSFHSIYASLVISFWEFAIFVTDPTKILSFTIPSGGHFF